MIYHRIYYNDKTFYISRDGRFCDFYGGGAPAPEHQEAIRALAAERWTRQRKEAAAQGSKTRARRRQANFYKIAKQLEAGLQIGPRTICACCRKALTDPASRARGIGPECWEHIVRCQAEQRQGEAV